MAMREDSNAPYFGENTYKIPALKCDGSNYAAWKFRQTTVMRLHGLLGVVNGTDCAPSRLTESDAKDDEKVKNYTTQLAKWQKRDKEAFAQIVLNIEDNAIAEVVDTKTANEAWTRIVERWEEKKMQSLSVLFQQLMRTKIEEEEDLTTAFKRLRSIASNMKVLGEPMSDLMLAQIMVKALPASYSAVAALATILSQNSNITSDMVVKFALDEEERRKQGVALNAMSAHGSNSKSSRSKP